MPLLIYYGTRDAVIPRDQPGRLFAAANHPKRLVTLEGADHANPWTSGGAEAVLEFLAGLAPSGAGRTVRGVTDAR